MAIRCHGSYNIFKNNNNMKIIKRGMAKKKGRNQQQKKGRKGKRGASRKKIMGPTLKKALADHEKYSKLNKSDVPGYIMSSNAQAANKGIFKDFMKLETTLPHDLRVIKRRKRDKNFMEDVDKIKVKPHGIMEDIYEWYTPPVRKTMLTPHFTNRGGVENSGGRIKYMHSMHENMIKMEGFQRQFNRLSDYRHNRGFKEKPFKLKKIERSKKISGKNAKAALATLNYLEFMKESRIASKHRRKEFLASFERFGEQEDEDESNDDDSSENQQGISKFDFSILGSASKSSKIRYAPNDNNNNDDRKR